MLEEKMEQWRDGLLSTGEILREVLAKECISNPALWEIVDAILTAETKVADERMAKLGI